MRKSNTDDLWAFLSYFLAIAIIIAGVFVIRYITRWLNMPIAIIVLIDIVSIGVCIGYSFYWYKRFKKALKNWRKNKPVDYCI